MPGLDQLNSTYSRTNSCLILNEVEVVPFSSHFPHLCCSVTQSCLTLCDLIDCRTPGFPVLHHLRSLLKLMSIESVMPSKHLILRRALLLLPSIFPSIRVFSNAAFASGGQRIGASVVGVQIGWQDRGGGAKGRSRGRGDALLEL